MSRDYSGILSRRELLKRVGLVGAAAAAPAGALVLPAMKREALPAASAQARVAERGVLETLTAAEADTLEAITARLIPTDASGPGAAEARAARYIDRALGGALAASREAYRSGLAAVDAYARASRGAPFARLPAEDQDGILRDIEANVAAGFTPDAATFFTLVWTHTLQGTFCDPHYGGNASFVGWDLLGYPGVRLAVAPEDQRLDRRLAPTHRSAYDYSMFSRRRPARARREGSDPWRSA